jgi:hypothetical protein
MENPVVAVGRKVKSVLSSQQRPSVRIIRGTSSYGEPRCVPVSKSIAEKVAPHLPSHAKAEEPGSRVEYRAPLEENTFANRFADARNRAGAGIRSLFGREDNVTDDAYFENEYDSDTVDLLDIVGMYNQPLLKVRKLTLCRSRSIYTFYPHKCPKFTLRPFTREDSQPPGYISTFG